MRRRDNVSFVTLWNVSLVSKMLCYEQKMKNDIVKERI